MTELNGQGRTAGKERRPLLRRPSFWILAALLLVIVIGGVLAALLVPRILAAKDALMSAVPLAAEAKADVLAGDSDASSVTQLRALAHEAADATDSPVWQGLEWVPVVGPNLHAVRVASESVDRIATEVLEPALSIHLEDLKPSGGAFDVAAIDQATAVVDHAVTTVADIKSELAAVPTGALLPEVRDGLDKLSDAVQTLDVTLQPAKVGVELIPQLFGLDGRHETLVMFQNNAEVRTTGGNPAATMLLVGDAGKLSIEQQASSRDLAFGRPTPVIELNPESVNLYTDRIGRWATDLTFTPDVNEQAELLRAFWKESFGQDVDSVASFDPVALSYLLRATGPIELATGDVLSSENAVSLLLNEVYIRYPENDEQDAFFADAAQRVFEALSAGNVDVKTLVDALSQAVSEGRLMYNTRDAALMAEFGASPIAGPLPATNDDASVLGVMINDATIGKVQYYLTNEVTGESTQCSADPATFTATSTVTNTMTPEEWAVLPPYILAGGPMIERGANAVSLNFYGPVGTKFDSFTSTGTVGETKIAEHLGRPVFQIQLEPGLLESASATVRFVASESQSASDFGPFELRSTPLPHATPISASAPGCE